jgi:mannan endo-1,4-beta-mannosidase
MQILPVMRLHNLFPILCLAAVGCQSYAPLSSDKNATWATKKAYHNLANISSSGIMIGYEDALAYGIGWWDEKDMCDMYRVSGEYPAIYGWDLGDIHNTQNLDTVSFSRMIDWIKEVHLSGGINTVSWHMDNPVSGASSWDKSDIVSSILPGGSHHQNLLYKLDRSARFLKNCKIGNAYIPIIFRPFHEHNGDWFWWGKGNTTEANYIKLYQFVAHYLQNEHDIHHLIYAFSPDRSRISNVLDTSAYLYGYPGDSYVDLIGIDNYHDVRPSENASTNTQAIKNFVTSLEVVTEIALQKGKVAALTETGFEGIKDDRWFTEWILKPLLSSQKAQRIAYILFWRNRNTKHHYMAYPKHRAEKDFIQFVNDPNILTLKDIQKQTPKYDSNLE